MTKNEINLYLEEIKKKLLENSSRQKVELSKDWIKTIPSKAGIYAIFEEDKLVYVGETGNIRERMSDMRHTYNHQLRVNIGVYNFSNIPGYEPANSKTKFPDHIEKMLNRWIEDKFTVSVLPLKLGRKELEENIIEEYKPKYNQKGQRKGK